MCGGVCAWPTSLRRLRQRVAEGSCRCRARVVPANEVFLDQSRSAFCPSKVLQAGDGQSRQLLRIFDACLRQIAKPLANGRLEVFRILSLTRTMSGKFGPSGIESFLQ